MKPTVNSRPQDICGRLSKIGISYLVIMAATHSGFASAQSAVTLYGTIDTGLGFVSNEQTADSGGLTGKSTWIQTTGAHDLSSFGLKGSEDLGGGTQATFNLQSNYLSNTGQLLQANTLFNRAATVGITTANLGSVTFGRQTDSYSDFLLPFSSSDNWSTAYGAHFGDIDNLNQSIVLSNAVKYVSPSFAGLSFGSTFGFGNVSGNFGVNRAYAFGVAYNLGNFNFGAGYFSLNNPLTAGLGGFDSYIGYLGCSGATSYCGIQDAANQTSFGAGLSYSIGKATIATVYTHTKLKNSTYGAAPDAPQDIDFDIVELNGTYNLTEALSLGLAYIYNSGKFRALDTTARIHQVNAGATYALSKRTILYADAIFQKAAGGSIGLNGATGTPVAQAQIPLLGNSSNDRQLLITAGIRHNF